MKVIDKHNWNTGKINLFLGYDSNKFSVKAIIVGAMAVHGKPINSMGEMNEFKFSQDEFVVTHIASGMGVMFRATAAMSREQAIRYAAMLQTRFVTNWSDTNTDVQCLYKDNPEFGNQFDALVKESKKKSCKVDVDALPATPAPPETKTYKTTQDYIRANLVIREKYNQLFQQVFAYPLSRFWHNFYGFDVVEFDKLIGTPDNVSCRDHVLSKYGQQGVDIITGLTPFPE